MSAPLMRSLSLGEALDASFAIYRRLFTQILAISFATQAFPLAFGTYVEAAGGPLLHPWLTLLHLSIAVVLGALGTAMCTFVVSEYYLGRSLNTGDAFRSAVAYLGRLIALSLATAIAVTVGLVFLLVPGLILFSGLIVATPALVIENLSDASAAMRRSWSLSRGFRGKLFAAYFLALMMLLIPAIAIGAVGSTAGLESDAATSGGLIIRMVVALLQILIYPFIYVVTTVLYYDLRVRKEGFDLEMLASTLRPA